MSRCVICGKVIKAESNNGTLIGPECLKTIGDMIKENADKVNINDFQLQDMLGDIALEDDKIRDYVNSNIDIEAHLEKALDEKPENFKNAPVNKILKLHNNNYRPVNTQELVDALATLPSRFLTFKLRENVFKKYQISVAGETIPTEYEDED